MIGKSLEHYKETASRLGKSCSSFYAGETLNAHAALPAPTLTAATSPPWSAHTLTETKNFLRSSAT